MTTPRDQWQQAFDASRTRDADYSTMSCIPLDPLYGAADGSGRSGTLLATASHDKTVRVWVVDDERGSQAAATVLRAHSRTASGFAAP